MDVTRLAFVIADATRYESMASRFRGGGNSLELTQIIVWLLFVAGIIVVAWFSHKVAGDLIRGKKQSPWSLFRELCVAHGVTWAQRRLLLRLARAHGLPHPVHLYLRPACFAAENLPGNLAGCQSQFAALREKLFGQAV